MIFYKVEAPDENALGKAYIRLRDSRAFVRRTDNILLVGTGNEHTTFIPGIAKDVGGTAIPIDKDTMRQLMPAIDIPKREEYKSPDGEVFYDKTQYIAYLRTLQQKGLLQPLPKKVRKPRKSSGDGESVIVAKIEPNVSFDLDGILATLKDMTEKAFARATELENIYNNLKTFKDSEDAKAKAEEEYELKLNAIKSFVKSKFPV